MIMKTMISIIIFALFFKFALSIRASEKGLIAYWQFNEGEGNVAKDVISGGIGKIVGANWTEKGIEGNALEFDGADDYVNCGKNANLRFGPRSFSIFIWVKFASAKGQQYCLSGKLAASSRWQFYTTVSNEFYFWLSDNNSNRNRIKINNVDNNLHIWRHVGVVRNVDDNNIYVYLDGKLVNSCTDITDYIACQGFYVGAYQGRSHWFKGAVDEIRIYNRALTAKEVKNLYKIKKNQ